MYPLLSLQEGFVSPPVNLCAVNYSPYCSSHHVTVVLSSTHSSGKLSKSFTFLPSAVSESQRAGRVVAGCSVR